MENTNSEKNLHKKLNKIRKEINQPVIFKIGVKEKGKFDLLDIECFGDSDDDGEVEVLKKRVGYIC